MSSAKRTHFRRKQLLAAILFMIGSTCFFVGTAINLYDLYEELKQ